MQDFNRVLDKKIKSSYCDGEKTAIDIGKNRK